MENFQIRTDLALETREKFEEDNVEIKGVRVEETEDADSEIKITHVWIETENGAKVMGKPRGTYITLEAPDMCEDEPKYHHEIARQLSKILQELVPVKKEDASVLVVGLGNREVTPDALGPEVIDQLFVTRHILQQFGKYAFGDEIKMSVSGIAPGVLAQTGMETAEIVRGVVDETKPDYVIVIDALAARSTKRLSRTIQLTDVGINPGSGVGNHRHGLNKETLGVPVMAIGVPTVIEAATIVSDTMQSMIQALDQSEQLQGLSDTLSSFRDSERKELVRELLSPYLNKMFVSPKDIDETIKILSQTISEALNLAFSYA